MAVDTHSKPIKSHNGRDLVTAGVCGLVQDFERRLRPAQRGRGTLDIGNVARQLIALELRQRAAAIVAGQRMPGGFEIVGFDQNGFVPTIGRRGAEILLGHFRHLFVAGDS